MPQMSPLSWLLLFSFFILVLMITASLNYFLMLYKPLPSNKTNSFNKISWKW